MNTAVISVGSNIRPRENVELAREALVREGIFRAGSSFVRTAPIGVTDQPEFLNGAFLVETGLDRRALKRKLRGIERSLGRKRGAVPHYGPREIDLDIVVWNGEVVDKDFHERDFVRRAVIELSPEAGNAVGSQRKRS